jgi:hypothetical protein
VCGLNGAGACAAVGSVDMKMHCDIIAPRFA